MCPSAALARIDNHADDDEMLNHLQSMMQGRPSPVNVLPDVNPCTYPPWDLPKEMLYFFNSRDAKSKGIRVTDVGYWQENRSTFTGSSNVGMITSLEFYKGQAPHGDRTDWMMLEYTIDRNSLGFSSLSRVFNRSDQSHSEEHPQAGSDNDSDSELVRAIWMSLENDGNNHNLQESSNESQVHSRNEHGLSAITGNEVQNHRRDNFARDLNEAYDFSRGDYLEDNDLNDFAASFSCTENSSITSMSSDGIDREEFLRILGTPAIPDSNPEQYNSGLSLRDLETPAIPATNQRNSDCHLNMAIPRGSHQVLIQPAPSGSIGTSRNSNPRTNVTAVSASMGSDHARALRAAPVAEGRPIRRALNHGSAACEVNEVDQGPSTSQSAKVHGKRKAVSWRIAKFGKNYCCFFQF